MANVELVRERVLSVGPFAFSKPKIMPEPKDRQERTFRPLASLSLSDRIIDCLVARYFRETLNVALLESCLAFRPKTDGRHTGLNKILELREMCGSEGLFVAECDIKGFYDCVSHAVARQALKSLISDAEQIAPDTRIEPRALKIFEAYLACYSFLQNVRGEAEPLLKNGKYPWPDAELADMYGAGSSLEGIGVPQGGSLSTLIANAVLHAADKAIEPFRSTGRVTYVRYCDDMIVLSTEEQSCTYAFDAYISTVKQLKLPVHDSKLLNPYSGANKREFWKAKSRAPFLWADPKSTRGFPWIQFLGYQIRLDGAVRIRPSSVHKELNKMAALSDKLLRSLRPKNAGNIRRSPGAIIHRIRTKLIAMGVGRRDLGQPLDQPLPKCWAAGFRWLARMSSPQISPFLTGSANGSSRESSGV